METKPTFWSQFKRSKRGYYSLLILIFMLFFTSFAEIIANDKPIIIYYNGKLYFPIFETVREIDIGGDYISEPNFNDPYIQAIVNESGWFVMPPIKFSYSTINYYDPLPAPSSPNSQNILGTDDQGRDILARLIYGFRISILFGISLTLFSSIIGIAVGAVQGYFGGKLDILMQRFIEIWSGLPSLYILIILSSIIAPNFWWLLFIMLLFSWLSLVGVVRAEFLKARNLEYVKAAKALGVSERKIIFKHILPNAFVASMTFIPFLLNGSITTLTSLDFLGLGLPPGSPSLGEVLSQAKNNMHAYWISSSIFITLTLMLSILILVGETARDILDPRK